MTDPKSGLPLDHPEHPLIKVRTDLVIDAIKRKTLGAESADPGYCFGLESVPWTSVVVPAGRLRYWFTCYRGEKPSFLFWRENGEGPPKPTQEEEPADPEDYEPVRKKPGPNTERAMLDAHIDALTLLRNIPGMTQASAVESAISRNHPEANTTKHASKCSTLKRHISERWEKLISRQ
jgi:hypothetical protein